MSLTLGAAAVRPGQVLTVHYSYLADKSGGAIALCPASAAHVFELGQSLDWHLASIGAIATRPLSGSHGSTTFSAPSIPGEYQVQTVYPPDGGTVDSIRFVVAGAPRDPTVAAAPTPRYDLIAKTADAADTASAAALAVAQMTQSAAPAESASAIQAAQTAAAAAALARAEQTDANGHAAAIAAQRAADAAAVAAQASQIPGAIAVANQARAAARSVNQDSTVLTKVSIASREIPVWALGIAGLGALLLLRR